ncbi:MAG: AAA family ATPase [Clostridia bacterium]|nr:AAA family ATPase [Clostridia bacterium]
MVENNERLLKLTVSQMVKQLTTAYTSLISSGISLKKFPSVMLWGPPGVGKSQGIRQFAECLAEKTGKKVAITDVRLLLFNPIDLRGIPTANADKTLAVWLKPKIFQMDDSPEQINILFLDEISAAPQSVQAAAYQITLDRTVGEHRLPDNCIVVAAGNRVTDRSVAYTMPKALANRLCHIEIASDNESWRNWAISSGINSVVTGFLDYNPSMLMRFDSGTEGLAFSTPRSWEMVSNILNYVSENVVEVFPLIVGCIGEDAAYELRTWSEVYRTIPKVEAIFEGYVVDTPIRPEALFALSSRMISYAGRHHTEEDINNAVNYASKLPQEFKNRIFTDFLQIKAIRKLLSKNRLYDDWFMRSGRDWDDYEL